MKMKKLALMLLILMLSQASFPGIAGSAGIVSPEPLVVIVTPLTHTSLEQSIEGFKQGLAERDYAGNNVIFRYMNAGGDMDGVTELLKTAVAMNPSLMFVLTTRAASEAIKITNLVNIPLVYAAVTDPVAAGIVTAMERSETLATGVSDRYPIDEQVRIFTELMGNMNRAGILFNPEEANSRLLVEEATDALQRRGVTVRRYEVRSAREIAGQTLLLLSENDCLIVNSDNLVAANIAAVIDLCVRKKKPLFVGDPTLVRKGAVAAVGPNYYEMGRAAGHKAAQILGGKDPREIPSEYPASFDYIINTRAARLMGLTIPQSFWDQRQIWESRAGRVN